MKMKGYKENQETPKMEAKSHSRGFLKNALKAKISPIKASKMTAKMVKGL